MKPFRMLAALVNLVLTFVWAIVGRPSWQPPRWLRWVFGLVSRLGVAARARPVRATVLGAGLCAVVVGGVWGWRWYQARPQPLRLEVTGTAPTARYIAEDTEPDGAPAPLWITFSGSAARAELVGKPVPSGVSIAPSIAGAWRWENDRNLRFDPTSDWPVGQAYRVAFANEAFAPHVLLSQEYFDFVSPQFLGELSAQEFYEDPVDPKNKYGLFSLRFSHAADKTSLERQVRVVVRRNARFEGDRPEEKAVGFRLSWARKGSVAYVHSDKVAILEDGQEVALVVDPGVRPATSGPGSSTTITSSVTVPNIETYFRVERVSASAVLNDAYEMDRVLSVQASTPLALDELKKNVSLKVLPKDKPQIGVQQKIRNYSWRDPKEVTPEVLSLSRPLIPSWVPSEREFQAAHNLRFEAEPGDYVLMQIAAGTRSFGDFQLPKEYRAIVRVEELPRQLSILHDGAILSLSGEKKISLLARNIPAVKYEISRIQPQGVVHLASQTIGEFKKPEFRNSDVFSVDNISSLHTKVVNLPTIAASKSQYLSFDFGEFLSAENTAGAFLLSANGYDPETKADLWGTRDQRLVLVTDLGLVVKNAEDGTHDVFVQSFRARGPVADATVEVLGINGQSISSGVTDHGGRVRLPKLSDFVREHTPAVYVVKKGTDFSFLPYERSDRQIDLSRFDIGGIYTDHSADALQGYLFSDRGMYRPGETAHVAFVVKNRDWMPLPPALPLEFTVVDPQGNEVRREKISFESRGFESIEVATRPQSPTGTYDASLYVLKDGRRRALLGSTQFRVEEFNPDSLSIKTELLGAGTGWLDPAGLRGSVVLRNLFGTPAQNRRVTAGLKLRRMWPSFRGYEQFTFLDPQEAKSSYEETLAEARTDAEGRASFDLDIGRFEKASYQLYLTTEGFDADGGRSVYGMASALVSPRPYFVGSRSDNDLNFIRKGSSAAAVFVALNRDLARIDVSGLTAKIMESRFVSVLSKQQNGTLAYQSVKKDVERSSQPFAIAADDTIFPLPTNEPGTYYLQLLDGEGLPVARVSFVVVGEANVTRSLERNAELQVKLKRQEYRAGDSIEFEVRAPFAGTGLITIEREKVLTSKWFTSETNSSVQNIQIPEDLEGNAYVVVTYVRSLDSADIFMSPLSFAAVPFQINRQRRSAPLTVLVPEEIKPGAEVTVQFEAAKGSRNLVYLVDEGILQVARYQSPDPLGYFFRKRALEVQTFQILDLLLPEFSLVRTAAPGGDQGDVLLKNLNPFKRRGQKPVVYWGGMIEGTGAPQSVSMPVPDYFNGTIRSFVVSVSEEGIAVVDKKTVVRGDFVLKPSVPYVVAPGDSFVVSTLVSNNRKGSGVGAKLQAELVVPRGATLTTAAVQEVTIDEGGEAPVRWELKAGKALGPVDLRFIVRSGAELAQYSVDFSIRPATIYESQPQTGIARTGLVSGAMVSVSPRRTLLEEGRVVTFAAANDPLVLLQGLVSYLKHYPYGCTEQVVSQSVPGLVLGGYTEFGLTPDLVRQRLNQTFDILFARQNSDGAFFYWDGGSTGSPTFSLLAAQFLLEARERGHSVPRALFERTMSWLRTVASTTVQSSAELRDQARAIYLLTRSGVMTGNELSGLRKQLEKYYPGWRHDTVPLYVAASYRLLQDQEEAQRILGGVTLPLDPAKACDQYCDPMSLDGESLYLIARHFPEKLTNSIDSLVERLAQSVVALKASSLGAAWAIFGLEAVAKAKTAGPADSLSVVLYRADQKTAPLTEKLSSRTPLAIPAEVQKLELTGGTQTLYYQLLEAGYDAVPATLAEQQGLEVTRILQNEKGEVITTAKAGEKIFVHVLVRATTGTVDSVALVDLLPGSFEVDVSPEGIASRRSLVSGDDSWELEAVDVREDRVLFFGSATESLQRFVYTMKASNPGTYTLPPLFGESMYQRSMWGRSASGTITVTAP